MCKIISYIFVTFVLVSSMLDFYVFEIGIAIIAMPFDPKIDNVEDFADLLGYVA